MFYRIISTLKHIVENPYLNIVVGAVLLYSGLVETLDEFREIEEFNLGAHHGIVLFAVVHILKILPDVFEGLEYLNNANQDK